MPFSNSHPADGPPSITRESALYANFSALDGLRGIAILWVLSFHLPGQQPPFGNPVTNRGPLGVELFFAISGFLVTRSLHQCIARASRASLGPLRVLRDFLTRRVARIWPPYFLALAVAIAGMLLDPAFRERSMEARGILWSFFLFVANYEIPNHEPPLSLMVLWSLCFEEQFYVFLALLYLPASKRLAMCLFLAGVVSVALRLLAATFYPSLFPKFLTMQMQVHWRFDSLAWGCLVWLFHGRIIDFWSRTRHPDALRVLISLGSIAVCVPRSQGPVGQAVIYVLLAPMFAVLVGTLSLSSTFWLARLLSWRPLAFVGVISYEIYLSHVVVYRVLARLHIDQWRTFYYAFCVATSIGVASVFHRFFSKPSQTALRAWMAG
jgi:peptidoglycan/LPS O-acetylase OafA/YrhL